MKLPAKIGAIEITEDAVRIAVVKSGGRLPKVLETAEVTLSTTENSEDLHAAQVQALRDAITSLKSPPSIFVLVIPTAWAIIRLLTVPFRGKRKVASAAPFELEPFLAIPIEELAVEFIPTRVIDNQTEVLAFGVRRTSLQERTDLLEEAGIAIDGAILDATALTATWLATQRDTSGTHGVLHIRQGEAILAVLENKKLTYIRRIDTSIDTLRSNPKAITRELSNILRAHATEVPGSEPLRSLDINGVTLPKEERENVQRILEIPVTNADLASRIPGFSEAIPPRQNDQDELDGEPITDLRNQWTAPIAAAAAAAGGPFHLNLLRQQFASKKTLRKLRDFALATCLLGVLILLGFLAVIYTDYRNTLAKIDRIGEAVWQEFAATYPDAAFERPPGDIGGFKSIEMMQLAADDERESSGTLSPEMFDRGTLLDILREFSRYFPNSIAVIQEIRVTISKNTTITFYGEIINPEAFNKAIQGLRNNGILIVNEPQRTSDLGKETFSLVATL